MSEQQKENTGVIFANEKKSKDSDPDGKGSATIAGTEYWVASWVNKSKSGQMYRKLAFTPKQPRQEAAQPGRAAGYQRPAVKQAQEPQFDEQGPVDPPF